MVSLCGTIPMYKTGTFKKASPKQSEHSGKQLQSLKKFPKTRPWTYYKRQRGWPGITDDNNYFTLIYTNLHGCLQDCTPLH